MTESEIISYINDYYERKAKSSIHPLLHRNVEGELYEEWIWCRQDYTKDDLYWIPLRKVLK